MPHINTRRSRSESRAAQPLRNMPDGPAISVALAEVSNIGANVSNSLVLVVLESLAFGTSLVHQQSPDLLTITRRILAAVLSLLRCVHVCTTILFEHGERYADRTCSAALIFV